MKSAFRGLSMLSLVLWVLAIPMPILTGADQYENQHVVRGLELLPTRYWALLAFPSACLANLFLIPLHISVWKPKPINYWGFVLVYALASTVFLHHERLVTASNAMGSCITDREIGLYLWMASFWLLLLGRTLADSTDKGGVMTLRIVILVLAAAIPIGMEQAYPVSKERARQFFNGSGPQSVTTLPAI